MRKTRTRARATREIPQSGRMDSLVRAFESLYDQLPAVAWKPLALALVLHLGRAAARSRAWRNVFAAAYPDEEVRWRSTFSQPTQRASVSTR